MKCSRKACNNEATSGPHRDMPANRYCEECRKKINELAECELIPASPKPGRRVTFKKAITNCLDCPNHEVVRDPDPHDSFCSDDEATLCKACPNTEKVKSYAGRLFEFRPVTVSNRPYQTRTYSKVPEWCPLKEESDAQKQQ